jgi:hypothetical protein
MKIEVDFKKKYVFSALAVIILVLGVIGVSAVWSDKPVFHDSENIKVNVGGEDYSLQEAIDDGLIGSSGFERIDGGNVLLGYWCGDHHGKGSEYVFSKNPCPLGTWTWEHESSFSLAEAGVSYSILPAVRGVILTINQREHIDWPLIGTKYIFTGGSDLGVDGSGCSAEPAEECIDELPFNQEVRVYDKHNNDIYISVNIPDSNNPEAEGNINIRSDDGSAGAGGFSFKVEYLPYYYVFNN